MTLPMVIILAVTPVSPVSLSTKLKIKKDSSQMENLKTVETKSYSTLNPINSSLYGLLNHYLFYFKREEA
jgi:hypothetical protein